MEPRLPTIKKAYHRPQLVKHGNVEELTLTGGYQDVSNTYGHIHTHGCGHNNMPGS